MGGATCVINFQATARQAAITPATRLIARRSLDVVPYTAATAST